jgi:ubiquinone/menaquinone biosynthesis C-methylase UbiE
MTEATAFIRMSKVSNPFDNKSVAQRYGKGRLFFHPLVMERIRKKLCLERKVEQALDVGCGTGLSSRALLDVAEHVDAVDESMWMLEVAFSDPRIRYRQMSGEHLDYPAAFFDLITICQVLHWTDASQLFREVYRVLRPSCSVVIYDDFFLWHADEGSPFLKWLRERFLIRFPAPPRNKQALDAEGKFKPEGFVFAGYEEFSHTESFSSEQLIGHLITQSNVIAAVDQRGESLEDAIQWLQTELQRLFVAAPSLQFPFGGHIYYLVRES